MSDKIINSFQQRRQLNQAFDELGQSQNEAELLAQVRVMQHTFPHDLLLSQLLKLLDTPNSQLRGGLGHLAALLPPDEAVPALRSAAANRNNSPQIRITAGLLLERYLGETLSPALLGDLNQSNEVAFQSLLEAVEEAVTNRHILIEYVTQLRETNEATAMMVMGLIDRLAPEQQLGLLRLLALDDRPPVAQSALGRLEKVVSQHPSPAALQCLHALQAMLPPDLAAQATRTLRKLAFSGHRYTPPAPDGWRALCSPADLGGNYTIWFVQAEETVPEDDVEQADGFLLGVVLNPAQGILQAYGSETISADQLPPAREIGELVPVRTDGGGQATLLAVPFDFGRQRLSEAQTAHMAQETIQPLPDEYRLYGDRVWAFASPSSDPALEAYFAAPDAEQTDTDLSRSDLNEIASPEELDQAIVHLLAHPALATWRTQNRMFVQGLGARNAAIRDLPAHELAAIVLSELDQRPEKTHLIRALDNALRLQAAWLHIAGDEDNAARALRLAQATTTLPITQNILLARLIEAAITV